MLVNLTHNVRSNYLYVCALGGIGVGYRRYMHGTTVEPSDRRLYTYHSETHDVTVVGLPDELGEALAYEWPEYMKKAQALAHMLPVSDWHNKGENSSTAAHMRDGAYHYALKRLKKDQKEYIKQWIYDLTEAHSRNPHERALLIMAAFSGANSAQFHQPTPFDPEIGAMGKATDILGNVIRNVKALGGLQDYDTNELIKSVFRAAGVSDETANAQDQGAHLAHLVTAEAELVATTNFLDEWVNIAVEHEVLDKGQSVDFGDLLEHSKICVAQVNEDNGYDTKMFQQVGVTSQTKKRIHLNMDNHVARWKFNLMFIRGAQRDEMDNAAMCEFIDGMFKQLTRRLKKRAAT